MSKFRAKRLDNGQWAIGAESHSYARACIIIEDVREVIVDACTMGRGSEQRDRLGHRIYSSDIVRYNGSEFLILYDSNTFSFKMLFLQKTVLKGLTTPLFKDIPDRYEILGNIYDSPEVLREYLYLTYHEQQLMLNAIGFSKDLIIDGEFHYSSNSYPYKLAKIHDSRLLKVKYISTEFNPANSAQINIQLTDNGLQHLSNILNISIIRYRDVDEENKDEKDELPF